MIFHGVHAAATELMRLRREYNVIRLSSKTYTHTYSFFVLSINFVNESFPWMGTGRCSFFKRNIFPLYIYLDNSNSYAVI